MQTKARETSTKFAKMAKFVSAAQLGLSSCTRCLSLTPVSEQHCRLCGKRTHLRNKHSIQRTLALVFTAMLFYIPANIYPIMSTTLLGQEIPSTIMGGVLLFLEHESYFIAIVIFTASIFIPIAKMMIILWLCHMVRKQEGMKIHQMAVMYQITEFIGKWSMVDVFVVAILVALVQITGIMAIHPGLAAQAFATVVILTMLAAQQFDIRLIWDNIAQNKDSQPAQVDIPKTPNTVSNQESHLANHRKE
uniref:paraquat-inducible protein A n=1 Tax=Ningiella ruwaisensis TaxID=2364274 RepID=UPI00109FBDB9|nr:paraquat-inducible protein A [Ningiella ruwaisensis]